MLFKWVNLVFSALYILGSSDICLLNCVSFFHVTFHHYLVSMPIDCLVSRLILSSRFGNELVLRMLCVL